LHLAVCSCRTQFSTFSAGTRLNSARLSVTQTAPMAAPMVRGLIPNKRLQPTARWGMLNAPRLDRGR
jgi:hypothetical protein